MSPERVSLSEVKAAVTGHGLLRFAQDDSAIVTSYFIVASSRSSAA